MGFDDIFDYIGGNGVYQVTLYILLGLPSFYGGYQVIAMTFLAPDHDYWCYIERLQNFSHEQQKLIGIPYNNHENVYERCLYYELPYSGFSDDMLWNWTSSIYYGENVTTAYCSSWVYDKSLYGNTAISEYNLVCNDAYLVSLTSSLYIAIGGVAYLSVGFLSDHLGRKPVLLMSSVLAPIFGISAAFAPNYLTFVILRCGVGATVLFSNTCAFVIAVEIFGIKYRSIIGSIYWMYWAIGIMVLPGISYFVRDFQKLQLVMAIPMLASWSYFILVPESPRWLVTKGRYDQALKILRNIAEINSRNFPENTIAIITDQSESKPQVGNKAEIHEKSSLLDGQRITAKIGNESNRVPFKHSSKNNCLTCLPLILWKQLLFIIPAFMSSNLIYYGLSLNTGTLNGSIYLNTFLSGLVELPGNLIAIVFLYKLGQRKTQLIALITAGIISLICIPLSLNIQNEQVNASFIAVTMIGKCAITVSYSTLFIYAAELFPTSVRHIMLGICCLFGYLAAVAAPFMGLVLMNIWVPLPFIIYGITGVCTGLLILALHETSQRKLPDTVYDVMQNKTDIVDRNNLRCGNIHKGNNLYGTIDRMSEKGN